MNISSIAFFCMYVTSIDKDWTDKMYIPLRRIYRRILFYMNDVRSVKTWLVIYWFVNWITPRYSLMSACKLKFFTFIFICIRPRLGIGHLFIQYIDKRIQFIVYHTMPCLTWLKIQMGRLNYVYPELMWYRNSNYIPRAIVPRERFIVKIELHITITSHAVVASHTTKYVHGFCFAVLCCGYTLTDFPISIRLTSLALWQSNDCPSASKATLMNMDKCFMWIHYQRLHNHNQAKHNKTVCIFLGIYCIWCTRRDDAYRLPCLLLTLHYNGDVSNHC